MNLKDKLKTIIKKSGKVAYLKGFPGCGKTSIFRSIAEEEGWDLKIVYLSMINEDELMIPRFQTKNGIEYITYAVPEWAFEANQKPTLILFDEINRSSSKIQNAVMNMWINRAIGHQSKFADHVYFAATGNMGDDDGCDVNEFDLAFKDRLATFIFDKETNVINFWKENFADRNVNPLFVNWVSNNPEYAFKYKEGAENLCTLRSLTLLSDLIGKDENNPSKVKETVSIFGVNYIGEEATNVLISYLRDVSAVTSEDILNRYPQVKKVLESLGRDRIQNLLKDIEDTDLSKISKEQLENLISFLKKNVLDEELVGFFHNLIMSGKYTTLDSDNKVVFYWEGIKTIRDTFRKTLEGYVSVNKKNK